MHPQIQAFFDEQTSTISYVVYDQAGGHGVIIDPVLDYDPKSGRTASGNADQILAFIAGQDLNIAWLLETHAHADHFSAAHYLRQKIGGKIAIGQHIDTVQSVFKTLFNLEADFAVNGSQFDHLLSEGETLQAGALDIRILHVPGHTPADVAFCIGDAVFVGDTLFMPDVGTARCDFPGGNAHQLYHSIQRILALPPATRLFMCHDYPPVQREVRWETTVAEQKRSNIHVHDGVAADDFVAMRNARDATLDMPNLILPAIQINIRAGALPPAESNGKHYLKIPLNGL